MTTATRTVNRGANPFAPIAKLHNQRLSPAQNANIYVPIPQRAMAVNNNPHIQTALKNLASRMAGQKFSNEHSGELVWVPFVDLDINVEIQRDAEGEHQAKIIERFDPRIYMPVMATRMANGRYSAWEGQQTACTLYHLHQAGLLEDDFMVQVKAYDETLIVPGSTLQGEAVGNYGFRQIALLTGCFFPDVIGGLRFNLPHFLLKGRIFRPEPVKDFHRTADTTVLTLR